MLVDNLRYHMEQLIWIIALPFPWSFLEHLPHSIPLIFIVTLTLVYCYTLSIFVFIRSCNYKWATVLQKPQQSKLFNNKIPTLYLGNKTKHYHLDSYTPPTFQTKCSLLFPSSLYRYAHKKKPSYDKPWYYRKQYLLWSKYENESQYNYTASTIKIRQLISITAIWFDGYFIFTVYIQFMSE